MHVTLVLAVFRLLDGDIGSRAAAVNVTKVGELRARCYTLGNHAAFSNGSGPLPTVNSIPAVADYGWQIPFVQPAPHGDSYIGVSDKRALASAARLGWQEVPRTLGVLSTGR